MESVVFTPKGLVTENGSGSGNTSIGGGPSGTLNTGLKEGSPAVSFSHPGRAMPPGAQFLGRPSPPSRGPSALFSEEEEILKTGMIQGPPWLSGQSNLALTDRNMHANKCLKVVLKSRDYAFFGSGTIFY